MELNHRRRSDPSRRKPRSKSEGIDWEGFLSRASRNLRQQVRRRERNVERAHQLRYRLADDQDRLDYDMDLLFSLHAARWGAVNRGFQTVHAFHREFATLAFNRGWLRLWFLELDGAPAAAWYGFRFGTVESYYQAGRDLRYEHLSIGSVLLAHSIREALNDGMHEYRFLRGREDYKYRFAHEDHDLGGIALPATVRGRAAIRAVLTFAGAKWARTLISRSV